MRFSLEAGLGVLAEPNGIGSWRELGVTAEDLRQHKPVIVWLYQGKETDGDGKHDIGHIARVLVLGRVASAYIGRQGISVNTSVVDWSIILHDAKSNHHKTPDHGEEAAKYFAPLLRKGFEGNTAQHIENIIRWHTKGHIRVPEEIRTPEFLIVTGADALDLVRMEDGREIVIPTAIAWELRRAAQTLYQRSATRQTDDAFEDVLSAAEKIGLLTHCA